MTYERLAEEAERPKKIHDHTARWEKLAPLASVNGDLERRVRRFCEAKRISPEALLMLEPRLRVGAGGKVEIAFAGHSPMGAVTAIKYRHLEASSAETRAEPPSTWLRPIVASRLDASSWLVAEGETDACRLLDLAPAGTTVLVLPCGAKTFKREWAELIPAGATVYLCHDADEAGDEGAAKAARIIDSTTRRLRPPEGVKDWCEWNGSREAFHELLLHCGGDVPPLRLVTLAEFAAVEEEGAQALLGTADNALIPSGSDVMVYGDGGAGKTTLCLDLACHLAAGDDWLEMRVGKPLRVLLLENEGPRQLFRGKADRKLAAWRGSPIADDRLLIADEPWARFTFAEPTWRDQLAMLIRTREIDVVIAGPLTAIGMQDAGTLQEARAFADLVGAVRSASGRAVTFVLVHHENKGGQVSGAWEGVGDTMLHVQKRGHGRTALHVQKARWASESHGRTLELVWAEGEGFAVEERLEKDDETAKAEILDFVREHPGTGWKKVEDAVEGIARQRRRELRDALLTNGDLANLTREGELLSALEDRKAARLYVADDPTIQHLGRASGPDAAQTQELPL